jgi:predicted esterase
VTNTDIVAERDIAYGDGQLLDIYRPEPRGDCERSATVLLWHGVGPDERDVLEPLATATASHGVTVVVPDWRSDVPDGGRAHLLGSLAFTRERASVLGGLNEDSIVLAGWSRGGSCAAAIGVRPDAVDGWRPLAVVCLDSGFSKPVAPTSGSPIEDLCNRDATPVPFWLVHGTDDTVVPIVRSREFVAALTRKGWPVRFEEAPTDHAGVIGTVYVPELKRCQPATGGPALAAGALSARLIAEAAAAGQLPSG